jgi:flagellar motor switch protein FliN/FliY
VSDDQLPELGSDAGRGEVHSNRGVSSAGANESASGTAHSKTLAAVLELEVPVTIELGRTQMAIEDVLALGRGSVVQLDRLVGQPVEVFVSDKPFATGEVVVSGDKFGVRILRIQDPVTRGRTGP